MSVRAAKINPTQVAVKPTATEEDASLIAYDISELEQNEATNNLSVSKSEGKSHQSCFGRAYLWVLCFASFLVCLVLFLVISASMRDMVVDTYQVIFSSICIRIFESVCYMYSFIYISFFYLSLMCVVMQHFFGYLLVI
jgi:hypothetical protein